MNKINCAVLTAVLVVPTVFALEQRGDEHAQIYFDITGRNVSSVLLIKEAGIRFGEFKFRWGYLDPFVSKNYSDHISRLPPKNVTLNWVVDVTGRKVDVEVSVPDLPTGLRVANEKLKKRRGEGLVLRFDIDPDAGTACAVWTDNPFPANNVRCR